VGGNPVFTFGLPQDGQNGLVAVNEITEVPGL
jgi:hypothetical protein